MKYRHLLSIFIMISFISCDENLPDQNAQVRKESDVIKTAEIALSKLKDTDMARMGYLDVTTNPYNADPQGIKDATEAIQQALKDARDARMICYLPAGKYLVSNTITGIQGTVEWDSWNFDGFADPWLRYTSFEYPNVLAGASGSQRTVIILADNASGFQDDENPKPVIHFWSRMEYGDIDKSKPQPNINFNQKIINLDFELGSGNRGAIAINHQGAEGSTIENVNISAEDAFAGIQNAPGSGGGIYSVSVKGGKYGLYIRNNEKFYASQPSPVVAGVRLTGQTGNSIVFRGRGPLTLVGAIIDGAGILSDCPVTSSCNGAMNIVDAVIQIRDNKPAIQSYNSVVLDNVFIKNTDTAVQINNFKELLGNQDGWIHIRRLAFAGLSKTGPWTGDSLRRDDIWVNGEKATETFINIDNSSPENPEDLINRHAWPSDFPSAFSDNSVNVKDAPYLAKGDGISDDSEPIQKAIDENEIVFLPKGIYALSKPLVLKSKTKLIGLGNIQTVITTTKESNTFTDPDNPKPLIETVDNSEAETILAFLKILVPVRNPCVYALCWRAGRNSIVRNVYPIREISHPHATSMGHPMVKIEKSGGGRWYTNVLLHWWDQGPTYRHLLVENTSEPLKFYMLEPQHGRGNTMVEINNSKNIDVFAMKSEGDFGVVSLNKCSDFRIFGYAGNGGPTAGFSLFDIRDSHNYMLANINPQHKSPGSYGALGISHNPEKWGILKTIYQRNSLFIRGNERFTLFYKED